MQPLNAIDAIGPAFTRTHEILFQPFRVGRSWKLAVSQYIGMLGAFFVPFPALLLLLPSFNSELGALKNVLVAGSIVATIVFFVFFYLGVRMQFVDFEMIVTRGQFIAPMWRRYGGRVWPVLGVKAIVGTVLSLAVTPLLWRGLKDFLPLIMSMAKTKPGQPPDPAIFQAFFSNILHFYFYIFGGFFLIKLFASTFEDFVMPFYILEDISLATALKRGFNVLVADPIQCVLYLIMKLLLSVAGFMMQYVASLIAMIPLAIVFGIVALIGIAVAAVMSHAGAVAHVLMVVAGVTLYLLFIAATTWIQFGTFGYLCTLLEAYSVYFLAGRYPLLADLLGLGEGPGAPFTPPPVFPSREERQDDDGGPPMPMDPAVA